MYLISCKPCRRIIVSLCIDVYLVVVSNCLPLSPVHACFVVYINPVAYTQILCARHSYPHMVFDLC